MRLHFMQNYTSYTQYYLSTLTLKDAEGEGGDPPSAQEIACHFSKNDPNVHKLPNFLKNDIAPKVKESF